MYKRQVINTALPGLYLQPVKLGYGATDNDDAKLVSKMVHKRSINVWLVGDVRRTINSVILLKFKTNSDLKLLNKFLITNCFSYFLL